METIRIITPKGQFTVKKGTKEDSGMYQFRSEAFR